MDPKDTDRTDILPDQIVEDDNGNIHILPEEFLIDPSLRRTPPYDETDLAVDNMDNDWPCSDVMEDFP